MNLVKSINMKTWPLWLLFAFGSAFFAGLTAILGKIGVSGVNSNLATLIRTVVILGFIGTWVLVRDEWKDVAQVAGKSWLFLFLSGLATGASWLCYYRALQLAPASKVAPIDKLSVVVTIMLGIIVLQEPVNIRSIAGGVLICAGAVLIAIA
jgi:transporter family protein